MEMPDVSGFSDSGLQKLQLAALHAFQSDEGRPAGQPKVYGVREFSDWRLWSDALERELDKRGIGYEKIRW